ncbi:MAG TPA: DUF935 domain-containing protein [bacterium]
MPENPRLLDAYGRPVTLAALRQEHAAPQLTGVRQVWAETVAGGLTPQRLASLLQRAAEGDHYDYLTLAEEIEERDGHYRSVLGTRRMAVAGLAPVVEAAGDEARAVELADAVRELIRDPAFGDLVGDLLDALGKGFSAVEINWRVAGGQWLPAYAWRDPRFFQWDQATRHELRIRDAAGGVDGLPLPPYKFIVHVPRLKTGLPIRGGLARPAAWGYLFKAFTIKDWAAFLEVYGIPMRVGRYGDGATDEDIRKLVSAVANLGSDAAAVIHRSMEIEFQNAVGGGQGNAALFEAAAAFWDKQLSKIVLGQTASTEGTPGKLGNEQAQSDVREDLVKADAAQLAVTLNRDLVKPYIDLNFGPPPDGAYPRLLLHVPEPEDIAGLTTALKELVPLGLRVEQSVVRDKLGLPDPEDDAELLAAPHAAGPLEPPDPASAAAANQAGRCPGCGELHTALNQADAGTGFDDLDEIEAEALAEWEEQLRPLINPIRRLIEEAETYEDLLTGLDALLGKLESQQLMRDLGAALFKARGAGDGEGV